MNLYAVREVKYHGDNEDFNFQQLQTSFQKMENNP